MTKGELRREIAKVQSELTVFHDEILPVILGEPLSAWQQAVTALADALPINGDEAKIKSEEFADFMSQPATPGVVQSEGGLRWKISVFVPVDWECGEFWPLFLDPQEMAAARERGFMMQPLQIKKWLMGLAVTDCRLFNAMCFVLPLMADTDPAFVKLALDPHTWQSLVEANADLTESERRTSLDCINQGYFRHAINNALLHVISALGNNHFLSIRDYLDHPCLNGSYTRLIPHYLFALLFQKVSILQDLSSSERCVTVAQMSDQQF